ncbi:MAG: LD-carboxypeptidase [Croceibacterium sp.]
MTTRIAICAPGTPIMPEIAAAAGAIAGEFPDLQLLFHDQCFIEDGHFAGPDAVRLAALVECANDPAIDAVWFAKGGYGANRIAADALVRFDRTAYDKTFLGYSDNGYLLAALYRQDIGRPVHGPMPVDIRREGGQAAVRRALAWLAGDAAGLESSLDNCPTVAFNLITLATLCGTDLMPDLAGHVVMIEEVAEHLYAIDRLLYHVTQNVRGIAGLRLGRLSAIPDNDRPFGAEPEAVVREWCARAGIAFLGTADIGHDADNKIVPFGLARTPPRS